MLLSLIHYSGNYAGCYLQSMLHGLGNACSRAAKPGWGAMRGGGLAGRHQGYLPHNAACEGGRKEARAGARGTVSESAGAGSRRGAASGGWVGAKLLGAMPQPSYTRSLWG